MWDGCLFFAFHFTIRYISRMAIYTHLSHAQIEKHLASYDLGVLEEAVGIAEGIENTNYLLKLRGGGKAILTLFEQRVKKAELPFFMNLMTHLEAKGCHCPQAYADKEGRMIRQLAEKSAVIISFLEGKGVVQPNTAHLKALGTEMARMHLAVGDFFPSRSNDFAPDKLGKLFEKTAPYLEELRPGLRAELASEMEVMQRWKTLALPRNVIHADLFPDNVFFQDERLSGVIDFYFACTEYLAYDLAICLNAWCFEEAVFSSQKAEALLDAYHAVRPLLPEERAMMPFLARGAALRFLMTRAHDWFFQVEGAVVTPKDPREYLRKWEYWRKVSGQNALK